MLLKLYKSTARGTLYWEVWSDSGMLAVHEGKVGDRGKARLVRPLRGGTLKQLFTQLSKEQRAEGFKQIPITRHVQIVVQYKLKEWGSTKDLDKAIRLEGLLNEWLGWTGNGHCDGNDIGGGEMNLFSFAVDGKAGVKTIVAELKKRPRLLAGAVVAVRQRQKYRVVHPPRFKGEFSIA